MELGRGFRLKKATPQDYISRIETSKTYRALWADEWDISRDAYRGKLRALRYSTVSPYNSFSPEEYDEGMSVEINEAKAVVDTFYAMSSTNNPKINVYPRSRERMGSAKVLEALTNFWWRSWGAHGSFQRALFDSINIGHGWVKALWRLEEKTEEWSEEDIERLFQMSLSKMHEQADMNPEAADAMPSTDEIRGMVEAEAKRSPRVLLHSEYPQAVYVSPWDMFVDPQADHFDEARWVAQRFWRPLHEARSDEQYSRSARSALMASGKTEEYDYSDRGGRADAGLAVEEGSVRDHMVMLYEFHDMSEGTWCVFASDSEKFLISPRESPFMGTPYRSPFEMIRNQETGDLYPQGEVVQLLRLMWEQNEARTQMMLHRRQMNTKFLADSSVMSEEVRGALESNDPSQIVSVPLNAAGNRSIGDVVMALPQPSATLDYATYSAAVRQDIDRVSGMSDVARGTADVERRSAAEARILHAQSSGRAQDKMMKSQVAAGRIAGRMAVLAQRLLSAEDVVRVVGLDGAMSWMPFSPESIQGQYDFEVEANSMAPRDDVAKRDDVLRLFQLLQNPMFEGHLRPEKMLELALRTFGIENAYEYMISSQDPRLQMQQQPDTLNGAAGEPGVPETANQLLSPAEEQAARTQTPLP